MKVLMVNGSPHRHGCTDAALREVSGELAREGVESEIFWLGPKPISGCLACGGCRGTGLCAINDAVNDFLDRAEEADGFVFGSPVHYAAASGAITSFMDRAFYADGSGEVRRFYMKPAAAVVSARRAGTTAALDQLNKYFYLASMPIVTSQYWNMVHGASAEEVSKDLEGLQIMRTLARNMAFLMRCKEAALQAGVALPRREARAVTNFIR